MTTIQSSQWEINGVIDTSQNVVQNLNQIATASGCFLTWDSANGTWSVVINDTASPVMSFTDDSIIGSISVNGSGISELYNQATIEFPHKDIRDTRDYIDFSIPVEEQFPQELPNRLNIRTDLINDPIQAARIAARELKQSRVDKIVRFRADYTANGLQAGDVFQITADAYGYVGKQFRAIEITERDTDEGQLVYEITGLEYDPDVYNTEGLVREERSKKTGIVPKSQNTAITQSIQEDTGNNLAGLIASIGVPALLNLLNQSFGDTPDQRVQGIPVYTNFQQNVSVAETQAKYNAYAGTPGGFGQDFTGNDSSDSIFIGFNIGQFFKNLNFTVTVPLSEFDYYTRIDGVDILRQDVLAFIPSVIDFYRGQVINANRFATFTVDWQSNTITALLENVQPGILTLQIRPLLTYDLDQEDTKNIYPFNHSVQPNTSGAGLSVAVQGFQI